MKDIPKDMKIPKDVEKKLAKMKEKIEKFKDQVVKSKFSDYVEGISLLPPEMDENKKPKEDKINLLILIDDNESNKMSKEELRDKLQGIFDDMAKKIDKSLTPQVVILSELWQSCYDGKDELLKTVAMGAPVFETGMLSAIKIAELHKSMVLKKFEKYIVSYVLAGSLTQGKATATSDIDVSIIIDDTDVKKMTRAELKDKLRAIIIGMGMEAGEMTGIKNKLNIQVWILTDFWDGIKEANPVFFTFLRYGVPFYDRGLFVPWKQLLKMGKIKPSKEAIDMYMDSGQRIIQKAKYTLKNIGMEDTFWAILTPSQAALMMYGLPPPTPKETPHLLREIFVKKEKILEDKWVKILEHNLKIRKDLEHGSMKDISGKEVDKLITDGEAFLKRLEKLFAEIQSNKEKENILGIYDTVVTVIRDALATQNITKVKESEVVRKFESELVAKGMISERHLSMLREVQKAKKDYDAKKLTAAEIEKTRATAHNFIKDVIEYIQRQRGRELEKTKIRFKHGKKFGEVTLLSDVAFIIQDIDAEEKVVEKAKIKKDGSIGTTSKSSLEEYEEHISKAVIPKHTFVKQSFFSDLKKLFGKDIEILVTY